MAYDSSKFSFSWLGIAARGLADGDAIDWEFPNDEVSSYVGVRGEGENVISPDKRCIVRVRLQANSPVNAQWGAAAKAKSEGPGIMRDRSSAAAVGFAQKMMCAKQPDLSRSRDMPVVEWAFTAPEGSLDHIGEA